MNARKGIDTQDIDQQKKTENWMLRNFKRQGVNFNGRMSPFAKE